MERLIYLAPVHIIADDNGQYDPFSPAEWNDNISLCPEAIGVIRYAKENDTCYTLDNFSLCFNLADPEIDPNNYIMFVPDEKFYNDIKKI